jgi:hypothetical protein
MTWTWQYAAQQVVVACGWIWALWVAYLIGKEILDDVARTNEKRPESLTSQSRQNNLAKPLLRRF